MMYYIIQTGVSRVLLRERVMPSLAVARRGTSLKLVFMMRKAVMTTACTTTSTTTWTSATILRLIQASIQAKRTW